MVLDEPNANLDGEGEEALTRAILGVRARNGIVVVIAHRPSALAGVDTLLVMQAGRMAAFGPKETVLKQALRTAFDQTMQDSQFLADTEKAGLSVHPMAGSEIDALLKTLYATPKELAAKAARAIQN